MELIGDEVTVRQATASDADAILDAVHSSMPELSAWMPWATPDYDRDGVLAWIAGGHGDRPPAVIVDDDGEIVGACSLNQFDDELASANLGYWVRTDRTGRGLAAKATRLVAEYGLRELGLSLVTISMSTENEASRRTAERAGAHFEGTLPGAIQVPGGRHDGHAFTFVVSDF